MRAKVIRQFKDKHKNTLRKKGDIVTLSKERFEEINSTALGIFVEAIKESDKTVVKCR